MNIGVSKYVTILAFCFVGIATNLYAEGYNLNITAIPSDSHIKVMNIVPKYQYGMKLPSGKYDILILRDDYKPKRQWVEIKNQDVFLSVVLSLQAKKTVGGNKKSRCVFVCCFVIT